jgi:hypothetical protein
MESRRGFLGGLFVALGGVAAVALSTVGCSQKAEGEHDGLPPDGATEIVPLSAGNYYANVMPDHVAAVRMRAVVATVSDSSTSKRYE